MKKQFLLFAALPLIFAGCASLRGSPELPAYQQKVVTELIVIYSKPGAIPVEQGEFDPTDTKMTRLYDENKHLIIDVNRRNQIIEDLIFLIDVNYNSFERRLNADRTYSNLAADLVSIGVTSASTLVGAAETKTILSAVATGITGGRASVDKNFYQQQSLSAIITTMRAERTKELTILRDSETDNLADYPMTRALTDLADYYNAGTLMNALGAIVSDAGANKTKADLDAQ